MLLNCNHKGSKRSGRQVALMLHSWQWHGQLPRTPTLDHIVGAAGMLWLPGTPSHGCLVGTVQAHLKCCNSATLVTFVPFASFPACVFTSQLPHLWMQRNCQFWIWPSQC